MGPGFVLKNCQAARAKHTRRRRPRGLHGQLRLELPGALDRCDHLLRGRGARLDDRPRLILRSVCACTLHAGKPLQGLFYFLLAAPSGHARDREANLSRIRHGALLLFSESGQTQQPLQLPPIEADHGFSVDDSDGRCAKAALDQLLTSGRIRADILRRVRDPLPRKKLFLLFAAPSPGLGIQNDLPWHACLPCCWSLLHSWTRWK